MFIFTRVSCNGYDRDDLLGNEPGRSANQINPELA